MSKSTTQTAIAVANSLIGSAMMIFPLNYMNQGLFQNILCLVIMGISLGITCSVYGMHLRPSEHCITQTINRIMGYQYYKIAAILSGIFTTLISSVYYLLASDIIYDVFCSLLGENFCNEKFFKLVLMLGFIFLTLFKNLQLVFKVSNIAMGCLCFSTSILIISAPFNFSNIDSGIIEPKAISFGDLLFVASINGLAFTGHSSISPMIKQNKHPSTNKRAIYQGFAITGALYFIVGIFGSLSIYGKHPLKTKNVLDYFEGQWQAILIGCSNFLYLLLIFPIFPYVGKSQLISLVPKQTQENPRFNYYKDIAFLSCWMIVNLFFVLFDESPRAIMGFLGSVVGFYFVYFIPVMLVFKAGKTVFIQPEEGKTYNVLALQEKLLPKTRDETCDQEKDLTNQTIQDQDFIIQHQPLNLSEKLIFGSIFILGVVILIGQLIEMFQ